MDLGGEESVEEEDGTDLGGRDKRCGVFFRESARADEWRSERDRSRGFFLERARQSG
jgi:hypothetical protein